MTHLAEIHPYPQETSELGPGGPSVLLLNNYPSTGIGDFGLGLAMKWRKENCKFSLCETTLDYKTFLKQVVMIAMSSSPMITNIGLTGWGNSGIRNGIGYLAIGIHQGLGRKTVAIVHHSIETFSEGETGYHVGLLTRKGAHDALRFLRNCNVVVFDRRLETILREQYGIVPSLVTAIPCNVCERPPVWNSSLPVVITVGYWAPYKGMNLFIDVAAKLRNKARFIMAGKPHRILAEDSEFKEEVSRLKARGKELGIEMPGYLPKDHISRILSEHSIGLLPYTSASGTSASFSLLAERGVPVVTTDLPEFRYLSKLGAGVVLSEPNPESISDAIDDLLSNRVHWEELVRRQVEFSKSYSWDSFVKRIRIILENSA